jgi:nitronate monooxygenase
LPTAGEWRPRWRSGLVGTRFQATPEALIDPEVAKAILDGLGEHTERSRVLDIARGAPWPPRYPGRTLRNVFLDRWRGREAELEADEDAKAAYREAVARGDLAVVPIWAGEGIDLVTDLVPAAELVERLAAETESALVRAGEAAGLRPSSS